MLAHAQPHKPARQILTNGPDIEPAPAVCTLAPPPTPEAAASARPDTLGHTPWSVTYPRNAKTRRHEGWEAWPPAPGRARCPPLCSGDSPPAATLREMTKAANKATPASRYAKAAKNHAPKGSDQDRHLRGFRPARAGTCPDGAGIARREPNLVPRHPLLDSPGGRCPARGSGGAGGGTRCTGRCVPGAGTTSPTCGARVIATSDCSETQLICRVERGVAKRGGAVYTLQSTSAYGMNFRPRGYHCLKLLMSSPLRTAHRTCSSPLAPVIVHRMCPFLFMRCPMT